MTLPRRQGSLLTQAWLEHKPPFPSYTPSKDKEAWKQVNHTSRHGQTEARYGQIERESKGILTGMMMNKMYILGTKVEVVTDHKSLIPIYNVTTSPKNLRVDWHCTKLLPFMFIVILEPGAESPCNYDSWHAPCRPLSPTEMDDWQVEDNAHIC